MISRPELVETGCCLPNLPTVIRRC